MTLRQFFSFVFILLSLVTAIGSIRLVNTGLSLQTDLLGLLPESSQSTTIKAASKRLTESFGDTFFLLLETGADNEQRLADASRRVREILADNRHVILNDGQSNIDQQLNYFASLKPYRFQLLHPQQEELLSSGDIDAVLQQAWIALYSPSNMGNTANITEDPLNIFNQYLELTYANSTIDIELADDNIFIRSEGNPQQLFSLISGRVIPGAFSLAVQERIATSVNDISSQLTQKHPEITFYRAGAVFHSADAASVAKQEINIIAIGSCIGILIIFTLCFKSLRPLLFSLTSIAYGSCCALVFCQWYFQSFHLLTLVFGASLIGVAIDYALHYLTRATRTKDNKQLLRKMLPSLSMGLVTSLIGYSSLLQAPLPGLQQMAVFSMVGLSSAWLFVVAVFPLKLFFSEKPQAMILMQLSKHPSAIWQAFSPSQNVQILSALVLIAFIGLFAGFHTSTDIRVLHTPTPQLVAEQQKVATAMPSHAPNQFFLIQANSAQQVLELAEGFKQQLETLKMSSAIANYQLISDYLPSINTQQANRALLTDLAYKPGENTDKFMANAGFDADAIVHFHQQIHQNSNSLLPGPWLNAAPDEKQLLWLGESNGVFTSLVLLEGIKDLDQLSRMATTHANIEFVDTVTGISNTLESKRQSASQLLALAYVAIAVLLILRYRRTNALALICIPLMSSLFTLSLLSVAGVEISLFHIFGLFLVLGLGMDYSIFTFESSLEKAANSVVADQRAPCQLAILLSVATSGLSFGLLSFSSTPMISAFGITVMVGSIFNWLLVPLVDQKTAT